MYPKHFWNEFRIVDFPDKIFVGIWFDDANVKKRYYSIIKKAIEQTELKPLFLKELISGDSIPIEIMKGIIECRLVLFDISAQAKIEEEYIRNANVMYELGLANTWRNPEEVIVVRDDNGKLPFDIQSNGVVQYDAENPGKAIEDIRKTIKFRLEQVDIINRARVIKAATNLTIEAFKALTDSKGQVFVITNASPTFYIASLPLLLNLGLVEFLTDIKGTKGGYGYHPTDLGREVIKFYEGELSEDELKAKYPTLYNKKYGIKE